MKKVYKGFDTFANKYYLYHFDYGYECFIKWIN